MEDNHAIRFEKNEDGGFEFAYFGIFDGHGGGEASKFAREHLLGEITKYESFRSENDDDVLEAIRYGFLDTHYAMWKEVGKFLFGVENNNFAMRHVAFAVQFYQQSSPLKIIWKRTLSDKPTFKFYTKN